MPKTLRAVPPPAIPDPDVLLLQQRLQRNGYGTALGPEGVATPQLWSAVALFQMQHIGPDGLFLEPDRVVGNATWWALANPSGRLQRSGFPLALPPHDQLTPARQAVLDVLVAEYRKDVHEEPDGSNRSPTIDGYWGNTGLLGLSWCCAFVSTMLRRGLGYYPLGIHHTRVEEMVSWAKAHERITRVPKPLDVWALLHPDGTGHTGFASAIDDQAMAFATLEGNAGNRYKHGRRQFGADLFWIDPFQDEQHPLYQPLPELEQLARAATR